MLSLTSRIHVTPYNEVNQYISLRFNGLSRRNVHKYIQNAFMTKHAVETTTLNPIHQLRGWDRQLG